MAKRDLKELWLSSEAAVTEWIAKYEKCREEGDALANQCLEELGLNSEIPLIGYVVKNQFVIENNNVVRGFQRAVRQAKHDLKTNELYWGALRQSMRFHNEAEFIALKSGYIDGNPGKINQGQLDTAVNFYTAVDKYRTKPTDNSLDPRLLLELSE